MQEISLILSVQLQLTAIFNSSCETQVIFTQSEIKMRLTETCNFREVSLDYWSQNLRQGLQAQSKGERASRFKSDKLINISVNIHLYFSLRSSYKELSTNPLSFRNCIQPETRQAVVSLRTMKFNKFTWSSMSLHAVSWACILYAVPFFVWAAHKNFTVLVSHSFFHIPVTKTGVLNISTPVRMT